MTIMMIMEATDMTITMEEDTEKIMGTATKKRPIANVIAKIRNVMDIIAKKKRNVPKPSIRILNKLLQ